LDFILLFFGSFFLKKVSKTESFRSSKKNKTLTMIAAFFGALFGCLVRAVRLLGFGRKPVKVLLLGLDNAGKTTLLYAIRGTPRMIHEPTTAPSEFFF